MARGVWALMVIAALLASGACGGDESDVESGALLELRHVVDQSPAPCVDDGTDALRVETGPDEDPPDRCITLGELVIDDGDVATARARQDPTGQALVFVQLTDDGATRLDKFAEAHFGDRLAVLVNGRLASLPSINDTSFDGVVNLQGLTRAEIDALTG